MSEIIVKVGKLPGRIAEVVLEAGATVADALAVAELDATGYEVRLNGSPVDQATGLDDGDTLLLVKKIKGNADYITVRVGKLPGRIQEIALNGGRSVADALEAAELDSAGYEVRVNGSPCDLAANLDDGDTLLLVKKIKGNADYITVRVGKLPGRIQEIALNGGRSVADALEAAELDSAGYEVRVNGSPCDLGANLDDGDTLLLVKKIKGN